MRRILLLSITMLALMGCSKRHQELLSGKVSYKGQPIGGVLLRLYPVASGENEAPTTEIPIPVNQDGTFKSSDVPAGTYAVVVEAPNVPAARQMPKSADPAKQAEMQQRFEQAYKKPNPPPPYPAKYKLRRTTDLKCTITGKSQELDLDLKD